MKTKRESFSYLALIIILACIMKTQSYSKYCHYSCVYCGNPIYSHCISCQEGFTLGAIKNIDHTDPYYNTVEEYPWGSCLGRVPSFNILGIVLFLLSVTLFAIIKNRTIFYFLNSLQTFALFSLIQIGYVQSISYLLQAFQYFMFVTSMNKPNKEQVLDIWQDSRYRMYEFLHSYQFKANFSPVFAFSLISFIIAFLMPVARYYSKKQDSLWSICNCVNIQKVFTVIEITCIFCFIFLIQQSLLIISVGFFLDTNFTDGGNIVLVIFYAIFLACMIVNVCSKNFDFFSNKVGEQIQILKKCILPSFIILPIWANVAVAPFCFFLSLLGLIFNGVNNKNKKITEFHEKLIKRQFKYRIAELVVIFLIGIYFLTQKMAKNYTASNAIGAITVIAIVAYVGLFLFEVGLQLHGKFWLKEDQKLYASAVDTLSSIRHNKELEETLQNFQQTEQGIVDMIFFSRYFTSEKESPNKKANIKLNLDILEGSQNAVQQNSKVGSTSQTPANKDNEKFKQRTSRTPKNDRGNKFKMSKAFEPGEGNDATGQTFQMKEIQLHQQQATNIQKSQLSQDITPKTSRRQDVIKTARQIRLQVRDDESVNRTPRSPRFVQLVIEPTKQAQKQQDNERGRQIEQLQQIKIEGQFQIEENQQRPQNDKEQIEGQKQENFKQSAEKQEQGKKQSKTGSKKNISRHKKNSKVARIYGAK